jgi:flagellar hook assembly protein FlgD
VRLDVLDVRGRLARRLLDTRTGAGPHRLSWDGRDESGREAGAGVYFVRLEVRDGDQRVAKTEKIALLK